MDLSTWSTWSKRSDCWGIGELEGTNVKIYGGFVAPQPISSDTLWLSNIAIENDHRNSGFSHEKWVDFP